MHIEKCSIERTETRTREMVASRAAIASVEAGECRHLHVYAPGEINDNGSEPVTLTYPAPVQVEGVRVEMTAEYAASLANALVNHGFSDTHELVAGLRNVIAQPASPATQPAQDFPGNLIGKDSYRPNPQPATLPWHDLGPGLSIAVVEGKGVYIARHDPRCGVAYFLKNNGGYVDIDQPPTIAAAKAACDAHAKGGEA